MSMEALIARGFSDDLLASLPVAEANLRNARALAGPGRVRNLERLVAALRKRKGHVDRIEAALAMQADGRAIASQPELEALRRSNGCLACGRGEACPEHFEITISSSCHPHAGPRVSYHFPSGTVSLRCSVCYRPVLQVLIAERLPEELKRAASALPEDPRQPAP